MKTIIIFLISIPTFCYSQWNGTYFHADQESVIEVLNKDIIIAATKAGGRFHRSTDGGNTWSIYQTIFTTSYFYDIQFPTDSVGYACGGTNSGTHKNVIVKSIDGGQTWDSITSNAYTGNSFKKLHFINADTGLVALDNGGLLITLNGGITFNTIFIQEIVTDITSKPNKEFYISTNQYVNSNSSVYSIVKSNDLGNSWRIVYSDVNNNAGTGNHREISELFFADNNTGYGVSGSGFLLKSTNGGSSWTSSFIYPFAFYDLTAVHFTSPNVGYVNNMGGIYQTIDGGTNWTSQTISPSTIIEQIKFANDTIGYALGDSGIYKTTNAGLILSVKEINNVSDFQIYPNPVKDVLQLRGLDKFSIITIQLYDLKGKLIKDISPTTNELNVLEYNKGIYFLRIQTDNTLLTRKVIIK